MATNCHRPPPRTTYKASNGNDNAPKQRYDAHWAPLASHAGVFSGARISSPPVGRDEIPAPLKTPAWEARAPWPGGGGYDRDL